MSNVLFQNYSFGFPLYTVEQNNIGEVRNKIEQNVLSITQARIFGDIFIFISHLELDYTLIFI